MIMMYYTWNQFSCIYLPNNSGMVLSEAQLNISVMLLHNVIVR